MRRNSLQRKKTRTMFELMAKKGAAQEKRGAADRTMPSVRDENNGIHAKNVRQRNTPPPILRPGICGDAVHHFSALSRFRDHITCISLYI